MSTLLRRQRGFLIIWGSRRQVSNERYPPVQKRCSRCGQVAPFIGRVGEKYFTLFFIPLFPMGQSQRFVECTACGTRFTTTIDRMQGGHCAAAPQARPVSMPWNPNAQNTAGSNSAPPTSSLAIASLVLGILSFVCLGPLAGIPGVICGIMALIAISQKQNALKGSGLGIAGLVTSGVGTILGLVAWIFIIPALFAVVVPSFGRAHELANRSYDAAQARIMVKACDDYAAANSDHLPPTLLATVPLVPNLKVYKSKRSSTPELTLAPVMHEADFDAHCDWIYIGADLSRTAGPASDIIVLYSKDFSADHGRVVAFLDGHAVWIDEGGLPAAFGTSNAARGAAGLPPVLLDGPPPRPGLMSPRERAVLRAGGRVTVTPVMPAPGRPAMAPEFSPPVPAPVLPPVEGAPPATAPAIVVPAKPASHGYEFTDALDDLRADDAARQRKAVDFLQYRKPANISAELQHDIAVALGKQIDNAKVRTTALRGLRAWVDKDNEAALQKFVDAGDASDRTQGGDIGLAVEALGAIGDASAAKSIAKQLTSMSTRNAAQQALIALGPDAESAVWPYLQDKEMWTAATACNVLAKIGTQKSLSQLDQIVTTKTTLVRVQAQAAITAIKGRQKP